MAVQDIYMSEQDDKDIARARMAALNLAHGRAGARFLAAHGRHEHANALAAALDEISELLSTQLGAELFSAALVWAERQLERRDDELPSLLH